MKLTESINICYVSVRVSRTIKVNIKETFMGNDGFLRMLIWWMDCSQRIKELFIDKFSIFFWGGGRIPATLGNPEPTLSKIDIAKFGNPSFFDIWTFWILVNICSMPRGLWQNCKVNDNVKQPDESLFGKCEHNTFETSSEKLQNLLGMKLATDVTLLFLSVTDSDIFVHFFMSEVWTMRLTESTNTCHFSDRLARAIKANIK